MGSIYRRVRYFQFKLLYKSNVKTKDSFGKHHEKSPFPQEKNIFESSKKHLFDLQKAPLKVGKSTLLTCKIYTYRAHALIADLIRNLLQEKHPFDLQKIHLLSSRPHCGLDPQSPAGKTQNNRVNLINNSSVSLYLFYVAFLIIGKYLLFINHFVSIT